MKYYRFINESQLEEYDKGYAVVDDVQISNPSADVLLRIGVKPLEVADEPIYDENTQHLEPYYVERKKKITKKWRVVDVEVSENDETTDA